MAEPSLHLGQSESGLDAETAIDVLASMATGKTEAMLRGAASEWAIREIDRLQTALKEAREAIAAAHHSGSHTERRRLSQEAIQAITAALNA
jgi:hypothetical protein